MKPVRTDGELLMAYANDRQEPAFAELVRRHVDWVYSAARRALGSSSAHLAEDVTQTVFVLLARKARTFDAHAIVSAWLFRTLRFVAKDALRSERRRLHHESKAGAAMAQQREATIDDPDTSALWDDLAPQLEAAVASLGAADRTAVLLRFYERKPYAQIGAVLGTSESAAQMRVSRALETLRVKLKRRGVTAMSAAALTAVLDDRTVFAAPASLSTTSISAAHAAFPFGVAAGAAVGASPLVTTVLIALAWAKVRLAAIAIGVLVVGGATAVALLEPSAPKPAAATAPTADQPWRPALERAYALPDGRAVRRVAPPYIAERQEYVRYAFSGSNMMWVDVNKSPQMMVYDWGREGRPNVSWRNMYHEPPTIQETICAVLQAPKTEVVGPAKLLATPLESDWVCRAKSSAVDRAADLERILRDECGLNITIRRKRLPQEVIVAAGAVTLAPGTAVQVYSDRMSGDQPSNESISTSLEEFLTQLGIWVDRALLNESTTPPKQKIAWAVHTSGMVGQMPPKRARAKADMILANVARQSGLQLRRETRPTDVWEVTADEPAK